MNSAPTPTLPSNTPTSSPDPKTSDSNSGSNMAKLTASILSTYDLPNDLKPLTVQMECHFDDKGENDGKNNIVLVETGPPLARHKGSNSFKFVQSSKDASSVVAAKNELVINAPLSKLYPANLVLRVKLNGDNPDLTADVNLASTLRINETQWIILNLHESNGNESKDQPPNMSNADTPLPTLRIKLHLSGPYRPEISSIISLSKSYFQAIDRVDSSVQTITKAIPKHIIPSTNILLVPTVPVVTICVVASPILIGLLLVGLPFFIPFLILLLTIILSSSGLLLTIYFSTSHGRKQVADWISPLYTTFLTTSSGQRFIYETGPRPSPIQLARVVLPKEMIPKLICCLVIDFIGSSSYLIPILGESTDLAWAPIQSILVAAMFDEISPNLKYVSLIEELLPFTDVIPTATLGWVREFGHTLLLSGKDKMEELNVVLRREKAGLKNIID